MCGFTLTTPEKKYKIFCVPKDPHTAPCQSSDTSFGAFCYFIFSCIFGSSFLISIDFSSYSYSFPNTRFLASLYGAFQVESQFIASLTTLILARSKCLFLSLVMQIGSRMDRNELEKRKRENTISISFSGFLEYTTHKT